MDRVLVANRGEIAVRIIRTLREMGITSIAIFSEADRDALHVRLADHAYCVGEAPVAHSYLNAERILSIAQQAGAQGLHPGYGFLSENAEFAEACAAQGLTFIGPSAAAIRSMGSKTKAREMMHACGVPIIPGGNASSLAEAKLTAQQLGYPVLIKASAGGGGKGMRLVTDEASLAASLERAASEAQRAFGDGTIYLEKALQRARHVEIQVLADQHGNAVHLFERDCSIQRRHQKVIEETPCPGVSASTVERMGEISVNAVRQLGYYSAGTFEFMVDTNGDFYFLEMNTRLQVEHPITEWCTGVDLVREMIRVARGERLGFSQSDVSRRGVALECRIYAEDPSRNFLPSPGPVRELRVPSGPGVRDDSGIVEGYQVTPHYDPLLSKLSVWAPTRELAIQRMERALAEYRLVGLRNNLSFHRRVMQHPEFRAGDYDTHFIERHANELLQSDALSERDARDLAAAIAVVQAHRSEQSGALANTRTGETTAESTGLSPWTLSLRDRSDGAARGGSRN
jgi:acetyl-CoA carboxylase biotin carboxylase subunit